ncbi:hypothetical protein HDV01_004537 [Terramyces sp. JEL0728]|nr:hypothetical protein HDV01_004537 [Terramyces sp. JEL0728]
MRYKCGLCKAEAFEKPKELENHLHAHLPAKAAKDKLTCSKCGLICRTIKKCQDHEVSHFINAFCCNECGIKYTGIGNLVKHFHSAHHDIHNAITEQSIETKILVNELIRNAGVVDMVRKNLEGELTDKELMTAVIQNPSGKHTLDTDDTQPPIFKGTSVKQSHAIDEPDTNSMESNPAIERLSFYESVTNKKSIASPAKTPYAAQRSNQQNGNTPQNVQQPKTPVARSNVDQRPPSSQQHDRKTPISKDKTNYNQSVSRNQTPLPQKTNQIGHQKAAPNQQPVQQSATQTSQQRVTPSDQRIPILPITERISITPEGTVRRNVAHNSPKMPPLKPILQQNTPQHSVVNVLQTNSIQKSAGNNSPVTQKKNVAQPISKASPLQQRVEQVTAQRKLSSNSVNKQPIRENSMSNMSTLSNTQTGTPPGRTEQKITDLKRKYEELQVSRKRQFRDDLSLLDDFETRTIGPLTIADSVVTDLKSTTSNEPTLKPYDKEYDHVEYYEKIKQFDRDFPSQFPVHKWPVFTKLIEADAGTIKAIVDKVMKWDTEGMLPIDYQLD